MWSSSQTRSARARAREIASWGAVGGALLVAAFAAKRLVAHENETADAECGRGFHPTGARCIVAAGDCPPPLAWIGATCDAPDTRVHIPAGRFVIGPSDWEAEGRVPPRTVQTPPFDIDAFEITVGHFRRAVGGGGERDVNAYARAAAGIPRDAAAAYCADRGGRLPTEDEWIVAASSGLIDGANGAPGDAGARGADVAASRYPWGETGAVCRRAAWGLLHGPCSRRGDGPDTVGAHPSGDTPLGIHDMAGNVAEWVAADPRNPAVAIARGGAWDAELATELRTWARLELAPNASDRRVGARCAYDARN